MRIREGGIQGWRMEAISEQRSDVSRLLCVKDLLDAVQGRGGNGDQLEPGGCAGKKREGQMQWRWRSWILDTDEGGVSRFGFREWEETRRQRRPQGIYLSN